MFPIYKLLNFSFRMRGSETLCSLPGEFGGHSGVLFAFSERECWPRLAICVWVYWDHCHQPIAHQTGATVRMWRSCEREQECAMGIEHSVLGGWATLPPPPPPRKFGIFTFFPTKGFPPTDAPYNIGKFWKILDRENVEHRFPTLDYPFYNNF